MAAANRVALRVAPKRPYDGFPSSGNQGPGVVMRAVSSKKRFAIEREGQLDVVAWSNVAAEDGDAAYAEFVEKSVVHNVKLGPPRAFWVFNPTFVPNPKQRAFLVPHEAKLR